MKPPKNEAEEKIFPRLVADRFNGPVFLPKYATTDLPTLKSTDRAIAWDTTAGSLVTWDGSSWS